MDMLFGHLAWQGDDADPNGYAAASSTPRDHRQLSSKIQENWALPNGKKSEGKL